jgi:hypothetical protein
MRPTLAFVALVAMASPAWCGTFGTGSFENDHALEWATALARESDTALVYETLRHARHQPYIYEKSEAEAVAAAEVVAALLDRPGDNFPPDLAEWVKRQGTRPTKSQVALARKAIERILDPKTSWSAAFWAGDISYGWRASVNELMHRLLSGNRQPAEAVAVSGGL